MQGELPCYVPIPVPHALHTCTGPTTPVSTPANQVRPAHCSGFRGEEPGSSALLSTKAVFHNIPLFRGGATYCLILGGWPWIPAWRVEKGLPTGSPVMGFALRASFEEVRNIAQL